MSTDTIHKTIHQYNKTAVSGEDMKKLMEIASDYSKVKNCVYQRYGGIKSLPKLYPGYTVQNEMTESGLRAELCMPSVYFYLAVFDALGDIKTQWKQTQKRVLENIKKNETLEDDDRHYLKFVLKVSPCLEAILVNREIILSDPLKAQYERIAQNVNTKRLNHYLCRQVRKHLKKLHTDTANGFFLSERAYRYGDHGIYISVKEKRKRIFVPLTEGNCYKSQIFIRLFPEEGNIEIKVPMKMKIKQHEDYDRTVGVALGIKGMFVTDEGRIYGEEYEDYQYKLNRYVIKGMANYRRNRKYNSGRKKFYAGKERLESGLHTYINREINRFLAEEKPGIIYIPKLPGGSKAGSVRKMNYVMNMWQKGYVRRRLMQKCREQSIELVEVFGKDISNECSRCGNAGEKKDGVFYCSACGSSMEMKTNTAKNVLKRGLAASG